MAQLLYLWTVYDLNATEDRPMHTGPNTHTQSVWRVHTAIHSADTKKPEKYVDCKLCKTGLTYSTIFRHFRSRTCVKRTFIHIIILKRAYVGRHIGMPTTYSSMFFMRCMPAKYKHGTLCKRHKVILVSPSFRSVFSIPFISVVAINIVLCLR